jgi:tRNA(Ile)-lysidine synthase
MKLSLFSGKRICVAISGGADSVALLHYLKTLEKDCGYSLYAVHCEHGIRGAESLADAAFVKDFCARLGVE